MAHCDDADLALHSVDPTTPLVCTCPDCLAALASYQRAVAAARAGAQLQQPPAAVWDRIEGMLAEEQARPAPSDPPEGVTDSDAAPVRGQVPRGPGREARAPSRKARWVWALVAGIAAGVAITLGAQQFILPDRPEMLARAELDPLPGWDEAGTAIVEQVGQQRELVIDLPETGVEGYREVWLIDRDVQRLVSIGVLTSSEGRFAVPDNIDLDEFAIVDVSDEPLDGDPAHSGTSIVRGELTS